MTGPGRPRKYCTTVCGASRPSRSEKAVRDSRILELRAEGPTQVQIAAKVGVTQPTVGRVLRLAEVAK